MPINRDLVAQYYKEFISSIVNHFKYNLAPWGGDFYFVLGQSWELGPVAPEYKPSCPLCQTMFEVRDSGDELVVEDSE